MTPPVARSRCIAKRDRQRQKHRPAASGGARVRRWRRTTRGDRSCARLTRERRIALPSTGDASCPARWPWPRACRRSAAAASPRLRQVNVYNWDTYIGETHARGLHRGDRHRRALRPVREQRRAVRQAARGQSGLRRHLPHQRLRRAHDRGRHAAAARPRPDPQPEEHRSAVRRRALRSGPYLQRALFLGHDRHRLSGLRGGADQLGRSVRGRHLCRAHRMAELARHDPGGA